MRRGPLRVGIVVDELGAGGAQRSALMTASALHDLGVPTSVLSARSGSYVADDAAGLPISVLAPMWPRMAALATFARRLRRVAVSDGISVLVTNGFGIARLVLLCRACRLLPRIDVVVVEHNTLSLALVHRFPSRIVRALAILLSRWLYRWADAIVGVSQGVSRDLETTLRLPAHSVTTIYNPLDVDRITQAIDEAIPVGLSAAFSRLPRPLVITTGRLVEQKAHSDLLEAFARLPASQRGSLVILGEGHLRTDLRQHVDRLQLADKVWMPGFVENPWWFIARSDVFALSSHWEGHPLVLLEALACGVPIASTDCPSGPAEILAGIPDTRLTPVGDTFALSEAIDELLRQPRRPGRRAEDPRYFPSLVAQRYLAVLRNLAS